MYEVGSFSLLAGDLSTALFRVPFVIGVIIYTAMALTIYLAAANLEGFHTGSAGGILIVVNAICKFMESHLVTSVYRTIATLIPLEFREKSARTCGITEQVATTIGAVISSIIVSTSVKC